ncbi:MAG: regulatory iron-sulfur-containing complex subunit RicT, partial [Anaerolineaceae bacterium]
TSHNLSGNLPHPMRDSQSSVAGVRFRNAGKIFYFHAGGMRLEPGEYVVVENSGGPEIAKVVIGPDQVVVNELGRDELKPILRLATEADIRRADDLVRQATELLPEARRLGEDAGFRAHIDGAEFTLDGRRLTLSFSSEDRVDYRSVMRKASDRFGVKVDMRQVGARDRAKLAGGYGICGRELCCSSWLTTFPSISIRMAKEQDLPLNPQKISGLCGRLLCCLSYEEEGYKEMRKALPKIGQRCSTPTGEGRVIGVNILRRQVTLVVDGQRIEVTDRDLGLVVRWDPSSKIGDPPPSISRADAIAQGMIEATEEDLQEAARKEFGDDGWGGALPDPGPGRGRLPGGGPRKQSGPRPPRPGAAPPVQAPPPNQQRGRRGQGQPQGPPPVSEPQPEGERPAARDNRGNRNRRGEPRPQTNEPAQQPTREDRAPRGPRPQTGTPANLGEGRIFQRSPGATPPPPRDPAAESPSESTAPEGGGSRRRGRRGGRGRNKGPQQGGPPTTEG